jgi:hypothetical protein
MSKNRKPTGRHVTHKSWDKAASITQKWKRGIAVGCSHGQLIDPEAQKAVLQFTKSWNPHALIHLGDAFDFAAFRRGAADTPDAAMDPQSDITMAKEFLDDFFSSTTRGEKRVLFNGNHEDRLYKLAQSPNAVVSFAAQAGINCLQDIASQNKADLVPYDSVDKAQRTFGDTKFMHGYMHGVNAVRDHAATHGKIVIAHLHIAMVDAAPRDDNAVGYCVGTLANIPAMFYAKTFKNRHRWSQGFVYFEYNDNQTHICLVRKEKHQSQWHLPPV